MAITLANLGGVEKPRFAQMVREASFNKLAFYNSGAIKVLNRSEAGLAYAEGARIASLPYWDIQSMTHDDLINTNTATTVQAVTAGEQIARVLYRGNAWGKAWLAKHMVGDDPLANIAGLMGEYWANNYHTATLSIMAGLFENLAAAGIGVTQGMGNRYVDSTGAGQVTGTILRNGMFAMGDQFDKVKLAIMHSDVYQILDENEDIVMVPEGATGLYATLRGTKIRVFVDDTLPSGAGVVGANESAVYLFGEGAFLLVPLDEYIKPDETASTGVLAVHNRNVFILHPNGISWQSAAPTNAAGQALTPTNANLANGLNWVREWQLANVPIVRQDVSLV